MGRKAVPREERKNIRRRKRDFYRGGGGSLTLIADREAIVSTVQREIGNKINKKMSITGRHLIIIQKMVRLRSPRRRGRGDS